VPLLNLGNYVQRPSAVNTIREGGFDPGMGLGDLHAQAAAHNAAGRGGGGGGQLLPPDYFYRQKNPSAELDFQKSQMAQQGQEFQATLADRQNRFNTVWGALSGMMGGAFGPGGAFTAGGQSPPSPEISVGGVYNPQQVQQQVNAARAGNDQATASRMRQFTSETTGRGFSPSSPLISAMWGQLQGQNMGANTDAEREIRQGAAGQNAQQLLATQQAREQQFASRQDEDIRRRQPYLQNVNAWISALAGLA
jgi:hypothetical protein